MRSFDSQATSINAACAGEYATVTGWDMGVIAVRTAGLHLAAPDRSGHCRASTASAGSQWALPDLNRNRQISVGTAGPQPQPPDLSSELQIAVGTAGPEPRALDPSGHPPTSTTSSRSQLGTGDIMTMEGMMQKHFQHRIPKEGCVEPRINLTWRWIRKHYPECPAFRSRR
eukprot:s1579_g3.t1